METKNTPLLSFAMPTYNFGKFIAETIRSIEDGAESFNLSNFEIVILDGGSTDSTEDVICDLARQYKNIKYVKQAERGGIDRDMNTVVEMASGKYIWLFSADDLLEQGWDRNIGPLLDKGVEVILVPPVLCDIEMKILYQKAMFRDCAPEGPVEFNIQQEDGSLCNYLNKAINIEAVFSFMSAVVVKADVWHKLPVREDYYGSCWSHCARLMPLLYRKTRIIYVNQFLIRKRCGNDSFMDDGLVSRFALSIDVWDRIIKEFFDDAFHKRALYRMLRKDLPFLSFIYVKLVANKRCDIRRLNLLMRLLYVKRQPSLATRINYMLYRLIPASVVLNKIIRPLLPVLIQLRRKLRFA